jgi:antirestriction protein ArdC
MDQTGSCLLPENAATGTAYKGINVLNLWVMAQLKGFSSNRWMTFKQAKDAGGSVRKGEKSSTGIFYKTLEKESEELDGNGEPKTEHIPMLRSFALFNLDQIDGLEELREDVDRMRYAFTPIEAGERLMRAAGVTVHEGGAQAFYRPSSDEITMPDRDRFARADDFYAVFAHELTHATKHPTRCDRKPYETDIQKGAYAFEELVAELGALFTVAHIGLPQPVTNHDSYIANWLSVLKDDKRCIFKAAAQAQKATDWILGTLADVSENKEAA